MSQSRTQTLHSPRMAWTPKRIGALVLLALCLILILQNWDKVDLNLFFWSFTIQLVWVLLGVFLLGALVGWLLPHLFAATRRSRVRVTTENPGA